jgi:hypothetical protein
VIWSTTRQRRERSLRLRAPRRALRNLVCDDDVEQVGAHPWYPTGHGRHCPPHRFLRGRGVIKFGCGDGLRDVGSAHGARKPFVQAGDVTIASPG